MAMCGFIHAYTLTKIGLEDYSETWSKNLKR